MRLSANDTSPYFDADLALDEETRVLIDGVATLYCVEASEEEGWADLMIDHPPKDGEALTRRVFGRVEIRSPRREAV